MMGILNKQRMKISVLTLSALFLASQAVIGAVPKQPNADSQALKKAQGMVRQLSEEKAVLETEKNGLQEQVKKLEEQVKQLALLQVGLKQCQADVSSLRDSNNTLTVRLDGYQRKHESLLHKMQDIVGKARQIEGDNQLLVSAVKEREKWIAQCQAKNNGLITANQELVKIYKDKGFWEQVAELEPFTGIGKVKTQDTAENYQYKLDDLKITGFSDKSENLNSYAENQK